MNAIEEMVNMYLASAFFVNVTPAPCIDENHGNWKCIFILVKQIELFFLSIVRKNEAHIVINEINLSFYNQWIHELFLELIRQAQKARNFIMRFTIGGTKCQNAGMVLSKARVSRRCTIIKARFSYPPIWFCIYVF